VVWHRTIVDLRAEIPPRTLKERAREVARRIEGIPAADLERPVDRLPAVIAGREGVILSVAGRQLLFLTREDLPEGAEMDAHAGAVAGRIREVLDARLSQTRLPDLLRGAGFAFLALLVAAALFWGTVRIRRGLDSAVLRAAEGRTFTVAGIDVLPLVQALARLVVSAVVLVARGAVLYLWVTFSLSQFPYTEPLARRLGGYLLDVLTGVGAAVLGSVPGLFMVAVVFLLARMVHRALSGFFQGVIDGRIQLSWMDPEPARATRSLAVAVLWVFAFVIAYPYLPGAQTDAFKGASVLVGLMVSLGSAGLVNQLMSGFVIVYSRALKPGDWVRVGETEGTVLTVGVLSTKIGTPTREEVTIPNAVLVGGRVVNYSRLAQERGAIVSTTVTIGYDTPWRQVHGLLQGAAAAVPLARRDPAPVVLQRALSDFYVEYELRVHHERPEDRVALLSDLHAAVQDAFNGAGVQIMSPHFMAQPAQPVVAPRAGSGGE